MTVTEFPGGVRVEGAEPFDLAQTLDCGQCFRFAPTGDGGWFGAAGGHAAGLRFEGESLVLEGATAAEFEGFWRDYLDLDRDYAAVRAAFARDHIAPLLAEARSLGITREELLALPGVGDYTASAIASAAFGQREAAVDGNVLRVVMRLTDCRDDIADPKVKKAVRAQIQAVMPEAEADIRVFNQATMELGATVCAPNGPPRCLECPAMAFCKGRLRGTAEDLPVKGAKKPRRVEEKTVFLLVRDGKIALRKRPGTGLLAGLWEFPNVEGALDEAAAGAAVSVWGLEPRRWESRLTAKHIFTHVEWHMTGYTLEVAGDGPADFVWADAGALSDRAVPSAFGRYYTEAAARLKEE